MPLNGDELLVIGRFEPYPFGGGSNLFMGGQPKKVEGATANLEGKALAESRRKPSREDQRP